MALTLYIISSPLDFVDNPVFRKFKRKIEDGNIYDTGDATYPASTSGITLGITGATVGSVVTLYANETAYQSFSGKTSYICSYIPSVGKNSLYAQQDSMKSVMIEFTGDDLYTLLFPHVRELRQREDELRQAWANRYLSNAIVQGTYNDDLQPSGRFMTDAWAAWMGVSRISGSTDAQFLTLLQTVLQIFQQGAVEKSIEDAAVAAGGTTGLTLGQSQSWRPFTSLDCRVRIVNLKKILTVYPSKIAHGNRLLDVGYTEISITGSSDGLYVWIYVDGSENLEGKILHQTTGEPCSSLTSVTEIVSTGSVQSDIVGDLTGYIGGKYVILEHVPQSITSIVQAGALDVEGSSQIILDSVGNPTALIDLGTRALPDAFGELTITYKIPYKDVRVIARLQITGTTLDNYGIVNIKSSVRLNNGARNIWKIDAASDYYLFADKAIVFTAEEVVWLLTFLQNLSHPAGRCFVMTQKAGEVFATYQYHLDGYKFQGVV